MTDLAPRPTVPRGRGRTASATPAVPAADRMFGAGGDEPYARALRTDGFLQLADPTRPDDTVEFDVGRWNAAADATDRSLLDGVDGSVIDIGCGPGRMLVAARGLGIPSLGVDVSKVAVRIARDAGGRAVQGSVFDRVPDEGHWDTALVIDGNIGIGGDPQALLARCREIVRQGGTVIVETHQDDCADRTYDAHVVDREGNTSAVFPWAEVGSIPLALHAEAAGLTMRTTWCADGRTFCELVA